MGVSKAPKLPGLQLLPGLHPAAAGPAAPAGNQSGSMIYYNRKTWFGVTQYKNQVIHKIFVNVFGKNFLVWYNKE